MHAHTMHKLLRLQQLARFRHVCCSIVCREEVNVPHAAINKSIDLSLRT